MEHLPPPKDFMAIELVDKLAEDGIASAKKAYDDGPKLEGALEGFELAKSLPATYEDFAWSVSQREEAEKEMKIAVHDGTADHSSDDYWRHRWATLQLEYCRDILLVAKHASGEELPPGTRLSGRAVVRYSGIVGVR